MAELEIPIRIEPGCEDLHLPEYMSPLAAGADLRAAVPGEVLLPPQGRVMIPCGFRLAVPPGYEAQVRPRSGLAVRQGVTVLNSPGTIDSDYRGEVQVILVNLGSEPAKIHRGDRIAQLVIAPVIRGRFSRVEELPDTLRGDGGFGHTGR